MEEVMPRTCEPVRMLVATLTMPAVPTATPMAFHGVAAVNVLQVLREEIEQATAQNLDRMRHLIDVETTDRMAPQRRGPAKQQSKRQLEKQVRLDAVGFYQWLKGLGGSAADAARLLEVPERTLRSWTYDARLTNLEVAPLGRPPTRSEADDRQTVLEFLKNQNHYVGVPTLRANFPTLGRNELADILQRRHRVQHERYPEIQHVLHWQQPGRVWAMDFAEPSLLGAAWSLPPVDGLYPYILAVRDLASGYQLAWLPLPEATTEATMAALESLFALYGAPLVLKSDNGSTFRAKHMKNFLASKEVHSLYSPPHWPMYNGSIEAAIGSLKTRTEEQALGAGHPGIWMMADLEAALHQANTAHPRRLHGRTPAEVWNLRGSISTVERVRFELAVHRERMTASSELEFALDQPLDHWQEATIDRSALSRALVGCDYLLYRRRRIPQTFRGRKTARVG
jgi:transposase InsO family protein